MSLHNLKSREMAGKLGEGRLFDHVGELRMVLRSALGPGFVSDSPRDISLFCWTRARGCARYHVVSQVAQGICLYHVIYGDRSTQCSLENAMQSPGKSS